MGDVKVASIGGDVAPVEIVTVASAVVRESKDDPAPTTTATAKPTATAVAPTTTDARKPQDTKAADVAALDAEIEGDTESDSVAVAPTPPAAKEDDDDVTACATSVEDALSPDVLCVHDTSDDTVEEHEDHDSDRHDSVRLPRKRKPRPLGLKKAPPKKNGLTDADAAVTVAVADAPQPRPRGRPRKRQLNDQAMAVARGRPRRQQSGESVEDTVAVAVPPTDMVAWDWDACRVYFDPLSQTHMDDLAGVRRASARVVVANEPVWGPSVRRLEHDDAYAASIATDVRDDDEAEMATLSVRPTRRGRAFRDAWEEEDFVASQQRPSRTGKKRTFAGCDAIASYRELVRGYDDELFSQYITRLEAQHAQQSEATERRIEEPPPRRLKTVKRRSTEEPKDSLPAIPVEYVHPAACGFWKFRSKEPPLSSFDVLHPAAVRSTTAPPRWLEELHRETIDVEDEAEVGTVNLRRSGRHETNKVEDEDETNDDAEEKSAAPESDEVVALPSFGVAIEEDELSREIANSAMRLVEVSALNWRRAQTLYERAVSYIDVTPLLQAEDAAKLRLEHVYRTLYPPPPPGVDETDADGERALEFGRRRPRDLLTFVMHKGSTTAPESNAVCGSLEFSMRLQRGDPIDVLDRNGCWNDGVVIDLYTDGGGDIKHVHVSFALWGGDSSEWVSVVEARILPRGVADGRVTFTLAPTRGRKKFLELNKHVADVLQSTYPSRRQFVSCLHLDLLNNGERIETYDSEATTKASSKKQRRR